MRALSIVMVAAMAENRVIGRDGGMPWHLPADMARFRALTMGKPIIMGRLTHMSLGRVLDGRHNIVLSRQRGFETPDFHVSELAVVHSLEAAFEKARAVAPNDADEIAIIGGASVYEQALAVADRIHLTVVHASIEGDALFPELEPGTWREVSRSKRAADERNGYDMSFIELVRRSSASAELRESDGETA
ncbi:MAG: dihydrofolate reductase [Proteobacteria bacterium]|nr:dihydrofolate reductase [Pseudomonadota bacterium]